VAAHPVIWFELWVPEVEPAKAFYSELFGWTFHAMSNYDPQYWLIGDGSSDGGGSGSSGGSSGGGSSSGGSSSSSGVRGALLPGDHPTGAARAGAVVYVSVPDLAVAMDRCVALGGSVERAVMPIGDGSSFAIIRDPFGTRVGLWCADGTG
jgi:uncharacterized protein